MSIIGNKQSDKVQSVIDGAKRDFCALTLLARVEAKSLGNQQHPAPAVIIAYEKVDIVHVKNSFAFAMAGTVIEAGKNSLVVALKDSLVEAQEGSIVRAMSGSTVIIQKHATVYADGNSNLILALGAEYQEADVSARPNVEKLSDHLEFFKTKAQAADESRPTKDQ